MREKKDRTGQEKSQKSYISPICGEAPTEAMYMKICVVGDVLDVITCAKFQYLGVTILQGVEFSILSTVQRYCAACDSYEPKSSLAPFGPSACPSARPSVCPVLLVPARPSVLVSHDPAAARALYPGTQLAACACRARPSVHPRKPRPVANFTIRLLYIDHKQCTLQSNANYSPIQ